LTKLSSEPSEKLRLLDKRNITIHNPSREEACECHKKIDAFLKMKKKFHARIGERERQSYLIWSEKQRKETAQGDL
jgi:hypothetical protein